MQNSRRLHGGWEQWDRWLDEPVLPTVVAHRGLSFGNASQPMPAAILQPFQLLLCQLPSAAPTLLPAPPCTQHTTNQPTRRWLEKHLDVGAPGSVNLFETTIRILGGLLSAQALSADSHPGLSRALGEKAAELGARLLPAFDSPSGAAQAAPACSC